MKHTQVKTCRFLLAAFMIAYLLILSGCTQKAVVTPKPCEEVAAAIAAGQVFRELTPQDMREIVAYLQVTEDDLTDAAFWMDASAATVDMIAVLTAKDSEALKRVQEDMDWFLGDITEVYRGYVPEEIPKLENPVMETRGLQLVFVLCNDAAAAKASLEEAWKP